MLVQTFEQGRAQTKLVLIMKKKNGHFVLETSLQT